MNPDPDAGLVPEPKTKEQKLRAEIRVLHRRLRHARNLAQDLADIRATQQLESEVKPCPTQVPKNESDLPQGSNAAGDSVPTASPSGPTDGEIWHFADTCRRSERQIQADLRSRWLVIRSDGRGFHGPTLRTALRNAMEGGGK
jgi:hypothetical protein